MHSLVDRALKVIEISKQINLALIAICAGGVFIASEGWQFLFLGFTIGSCASTYYYSGIIYKHISNNQSLIETNQGLLKIIQEYKTMKGPLQ